MDQSQINSRLAIIKYLYTIGCESLLEGSSIGKAVSLLHFHDAVESLFVLIAELIGVSRRHLNFMDYFDEIKKIDAGKGNREFTHKIPIGKLNELRVNFKHMGIMPNEGECDALKVSLDDFFRENVPKFCKVDFAKISLANSIQDEEVRGLVSEADAFLKGNHYKECLSKLGLAFYKIFFKSQNKTRTVFGRSPVFLSSKPDFFHTGLSFDMQREMEKIIRPVSEPIVETLNIIILGIDYKKYAKFKHLTPDFVMMADDSIRENDNGGEFNTRFNINRRNSEFCYFFVIDSVLKIEKFDFDLVSSWVKPDKVTVLDEDNVALYQIIGNNEFKIVGKVEKGTIIKFGGIGRAIPDGTNFLQIETDTRDGWVKKPIITKQIDHPELKKEND